MLSVATVGAYIAYGLPIFFRVTTARRSFVPGPFHLGKYGLLVGWVAVAWVALVTVLFSLPVAYPVAEDNFNYTAVLVGGVLLLSVGAWVLRAPRPVLVPRAHHQCRRVMLPFHCGSRNCIFFFFFLGGAVCCGVVVA